MSGDDKTLQQTLNEVIGEQETATAAASEKETDGGISAKETTEETQSGETSEFVSGIDIKDIPEQDRPRIKELLKKKADLLEKGYQPKFQEVAELKKSLEWLKSEGLSASEATEQLRKYAQQKKNPVTTTQEKKEAVKTLDKLLETSPIEQRASLEQLRQIVLEEANTSELKKEIEGIKQALGIVSSSAQKSREKEISLELDTTYSEKFGKDFIGKHRDRILSVALKFPNEPISKIIKIETPDDEYEQALLAKKIGNKKPLTEEKRNAISSKGEGVSLAKDTVNTKGSYKDMLLDLIKK
jgi:hypothetical protein